MFYNKTTIGVDSIKMVMYVSMKLWNFLENRFACGLELKIKVNQ